MNMGTYFAPLVTLPTIIIEPGEYRTRADDVVTIHTTSNRHDFGCHGHYGADGVIDGWHRSGRLFAGMESGNDIVARVAA